MAVDFGCLQGYRVGAERLHGVADCARKARELYV